MIGAPVAAAIAVALASCNGTDATYTIGGSVSGTSGPVVLRLNGANDISMNGDGDFKFTQKLFKDDTFNVQVADPTDRCTIQNGAGVVAQQNITDVNISCASYASFPAGLLQIVVRSANLSGARVNPVVTTSATGVGGIMVDPTAKDINNNVPVVGGIVLTGLTPPPTRITINQAQKGVPTSNGNPIVDLFLANDGVTAVVDPAGTLDSSALTALFAGELYFNVATAANPNGEIRGQIEVQGGVGATVTDLGSSLVIPPTGSTAIGVGALMVDLATRKIIISYIGHTVAAATAAGMSTSNVPAGQILDFKTLQNSFDGKGTNLAVPPAGSVMTEQNLSDFNGNFLYFSVSSGTFPNGEIRGDIAPLPQ
jgi:hypothetical protein